MTRPWSKQPVESLSPKQLEALEARRERIVAAAEHLMSESGRDVTMAQIATESGLGMSSVYRTFASREELLGDLAGRRAERWVEIWRAAALESDPRAGLVGALWTFGELEAADPLADVVREHVLAHDEDFRPVTEAGLVVVARAREAGLRPEIGYDDIVRSIQVLSAVPRGASRPWRRVLAIYIDGMFAVGAGPLLPTLD